MVDWLTDPNAVVGAFIGLLLVAKVFVDKSTSRPRRVHTVRLEFLD